MAADYLSRASFYFLLALLFIFAVNVHTAAAQTTILSQAPNQVNGYFTDPDCDQCGSGVQALAENFVVTSAVEVTEVRIWGGYFPQNIPLVSDSFTVIFHYDSSGLPGGNVVPPESSVPSSRLDTGVDLFGVDEYLFTLTLANPVLLWPGTYWVEIFNDSTGSTESFFWETGNLDAVNGITGYAGDITSVPGSFWLSLGGEDIAVEITAEPYIPAPTMNEWGMIIFMILAGISSVYYIRKQKKA